MPGVGYRLVEGRKAMEKNADLSTPWAGAISAGDGWVVFSGASAGNSFHARPALQVTMTKDAAPVTLYGQQGEAYRDRAILVRPGVRHRLEPHPDVQVLLVEPQGPLALHLQSEAPDAPITGVPSSLLANLANGPEAVLSGLKPRALDPALERALTALRQVQDGIDVAGAARFADVSVSRLRTIARNELGVTLSEWLVWRKLDRACAALTRGARLVDAAARGGFADQAHLTRTMRRVFGVTPGMSKAWRRTAIPALARTLSEMFKTATAPIGNCHPSTTTPMEERRMAVNAYDKYKVEMAASREAEHAGDNAAALAHLERAHILGQRYLIPHLATHWRMLKLARAAQNGPETRGQILRLVAAIPGYVFGWVPVGNTGGANVSAVKPMPVPPDLAPYFESYSVWTGVLVRVGIVSIASIGTLYVTTA
jgi:AraC-like DNA-binding protein